MEQELRWKPSSLLASGAADFTWECIYIYMEYIYIYICICMFFEVAYGLTGWAGFLLSGTLGTGAPMSVRVAGPRK